MKKILVVDDSTTMRKIVTMALSAGNYAFVEASNGKEALVKIGSGGFDAVVLDVNMPEMNGLEFLEAKRGMPAIASIPVVMLTTQDELPMQQQAKALGARAFLGKPFRKEDLLAVLSALLP